MAVQIIPRGPSMGETLGKGLSTALGLYYTNKKKKEKEAQAQSDLADALKAYGLSKKKAEAFSKLPKETFNEVFRGAQKAQQQELDYSNRAAVLEGSGYSKADADVIARDDRTFQAALNEAEMGGTFGSGDIPSTATQQWRRDMRDPEGATIGAMMNQQAQEPIGQATPTQETQAAQQMQSRQQQQQDQSGMRMGLAPADPKDVKELKNLFTEGFDSKSLNKDEAEKILDLLGIDDLSREVIFSKKMTPRIATDFFGPMAKGNAKKAKQLAKAYGFKIK